MDARLAMPEGSLRVVMFRQCWTAVAWCVQWNYSCRKPGALPCHSFRISSLLEITSLLPSPIWGCQAMSSLENATLASQPNPEELDGLGLCFFLTEAFKHLADSLHPWPVLTHKPLKLQEFTSAWTASEVTIIDNIYKVHLTLYFTERNDFLNCTLKWD